MGSRNGVILHSHSETSRVESQKYISKTTVQCFLTPAHHHPTQTHMGSAMGSRRPELLCKKHHAASRFGRSQPASRNRRPDHIDRSHRGRVCPHSVSCRGGRFHHATKTKEHRLGLGRRSACALRRRTANGLWGSFLRFETHRDDEEREYMCCRSVGKLSFAAPPRT